MPPGALRLETWQTQIVGKARVVEVLLELVLVLVEEKLHWTRRGLSEWE